MRISDKKKSELYAAIHNPVMDSRVANKMTVKQMSKEDIDQMLFRLTSQIWDQVQTTLKITD